jgi:hypothetical protein
MWALLSNPEHAASFEQLGEAYAPLRRLVEQLTGREYAGRVHAFKWMASFNLTTAPTSQEVGGHDGIGIDYIPDQGVFRIGYDDRAIPHHSPPFLTAAPHEVGELIDQHVQRLLLSPRPPEPEPPRALVIVGLVMIAALCVVPLCVGLMFAGVSEQLLGRVALVSGGIAGTATSLLFIGQALNTNWAGGRWGPRPGRWPLPPNRLMSLGGGLVFGAGGVTFLGLDWLTEHIYPGLLGALAAGIVLVLVGHRFALRRGDAAWEIRKALLAYADRHDGWFPKGETSPEASLSLLHWETKLVTANVLRGSTAPETAVRARLDAGELLTPETCGWHYVEGLRADDDPQLALFWDKLGPGCTDALLSGGCHYVIFLDGSVEYIPGTEWEAFLDKQERLRAAIGR